MPESRLETVRLLELFCSRPDKEVLLVQFNKIISTTDKLARVYRTIAVPHMNKATSDTGTGTTQRKEADQDNNGDRLMVSNSWFRIKCRLL